MTERRSRGGPGGSRRPPSSLPGGSRSRAAGTRPNPADTGSTTAVRPVAATSSLSGLPPERRSRLTGRAAVLVLVASVLTVSYGSSLKAYLQQRSQIAELKEQIAVREQSIGALEREKRRWEDPAFVQAQARERFGYLMPGETSYVVLDENGQPLESEARLHDPDEVVRVEPTAWWTTAWASVELAGVPPVEKGGDGKPPASEIDGTKE
jgi:cell division protein FtsB